MASLPTAAPKPSSLMIGSKCTASTVTLGAWKPPSSRSSIQLPSRSTPKSSKGPGVPSELFSGSPLAKSPERVHQELSLEFDGFSSVRGERGEVGETPRHKKRRVDKHKSKKGKDSVLE
jgi:hypothetical protein